MANGEAPGRTPRRAVVVGAGIVGLSTAWHLARRGVEVVVVERAEVAAGASWGNAGWLSPGLVAPLPDPEVRRYVLRALTDPSSAIYIPPSLDPATWTFLAHFALRCTPASWRRALAALVTFSREALEAYDELSAAGVTGQTVEAPVLTAFVRASDARAVGHELELLSRAGQPVTWSDLDQASARALAPHLSERVSSALRIDGQRFVDPGSFVRSLADAVRASGTQIATGFDVGTLRAGNDGVLVESTAHEQLSADVVIVSTGAWLDRLVTPVAGLSVRAGRGYSFTVDADPIPSCPMYFPHARVACTPYRGALRVGGGMEIASPDAPLDQRRIRAVEADVRPYLEGVDWSSRRDDWVGPRPITADGLPVIGASALPGVFVAGGHGMWGMTLGPATGKLLASFVAERSRPDALAPFDPLRRLRPLRRGRRRR